MSKLSVINRDLKRRKTVKKYKEVRTSLMKILHDSKASADEKFSARVKLQGLPRNSSPIRLRNRCILTGRPRGVYKKFGLARGKLREIAMRGEIPGIIKASW